MRAGKKNTQKSTGFDIINSVCMTNSGDRKATMLTFKSDFDAIKGSL